MTISATVRVLVRNLESDVSKLQFSNFFIEELRQGNLQQLEAVRKYFPDATYGEWILERNYSAIPPVAEDWSGFGNIPFEIEDILLLLRLYRPGDLAFTGMSITKDSHTGRQFPYRAISGLVGNSSRPFRFTQSDCVNWEKFESSLRMSPQWSSSWFAVSRRYFLYGGGKEFNPNFPGEVDRIMDYMIALEASLVPESEFVSRRLRERAVRLLQLKGNQESVAKNLLNKMYAIRSTLAHGSPLGDDQMRLLRDKAQWHEFETLVRQILISALTNIPPMEANRRFYLTNFYNVSDAERAEQIKQNFRTMTDANEMRLLLESFQQKQIVEQNSSITALRRILRLFRKWKWKLSQMFGLGKNK